MANAALWENPAWLEIILKKHEADSKISKIINLDYKKATAAGDNYTSNMLRVTMTSILGDGKPVKGTIIVKKALENLKDETLGLVSTVFRSEAQIYNYILKKYDELIRGTVLHGSSLWPKCYHASLHGVVMEDLKALGFILANRKSGLDQAHGQVAMKKLGAFHAYSRVSLIRKEIDPTIVGSWTILKFPGLFRTSFRALALAMKSAWGPEWAEASEKVNSIADSVGSKIEQLYHEEPPMKVICHGDAWASNLLFKYDSEKQPVDAKFVDFQCVHYASIAWDIVYFIHTSIQPEVKLSNMDNFIEHYLNSFKETLEILGHNSDMAPTTDMLHKELERLQLLELLNSVIFAPAMLSDIVLDVDIFMNDPVKFSTLLCDSKIMEYNKRDMKKFLNNGII